MLRLMGGPLMFSPEKIGSTTIKKPEPDVLAVDIREKMESTLKKPEIADVLAVDIKDLRAIFLFLGGTMKFLSEKMGSIIKKLEAAEVAGGVGIKDLIAMLRLFVGRMKFLSEKIRSVIKMPGAKFGGGGGGVDVKDLIAMVQSLGGTAKFLLEAGVVGADMKILRAVFELLVGAMKFMSEKVGSRMKWPTVEVVGLEMRDLSRDGVTYCAKVAVSNPFIIPIPMGEISYTLKSDDRMIVSGKMGKVGSMPANETTVVEVPVRVAHAVLLILMKDIGADGDIDYQLDLAVKVISLPLFGDLITIPLSWKGEIKIPSLFSIF